MFHRGLIPGKLFGHFTLRQKGFNSIKSDTFNSLCLRVDCSWLYVPRTSYPFKIRRFGTSLGVQWLRLQAYNVGYLGLTPDKRARFHMLQLRPGTAKYLKNKNEKHRFKWFFFVLFSRKFLFRSILYLFCPTVLLFWSWGLEWRRNLYYACVESP